MDGNPKDEFDGYMCNISNDATNDGTLKIIVLNFMNQSMNEEGNSEEEQEQGDNENGRNSCIPSKDWFI
jgi:hypothetical protein